MITTCDNIQIGQMLFKVFLHFDVKCLNLLDYIAT
jgi:hypothetical protein